MGLTTKQLKILLPRQRLKLLQKLKLYSSAERLTQLCQMFSVHPHLYMCVLFRAVSRGILNASIQVCSGSFWHCNCGMLEQRDVQQVGHHSEVPCHALYMPLEFLPGSKEKWQSILVPSQGPPAFVMWSSSIIGTVPDFLWTSKVVFFI